MAEKHGFEEFYARALIIGTPDKDLRVVAVVGGSEDNRIEHVNLNKVDDELIAMVIMHLLNLSIQQPLLKRILMEESSLLISVEAGQVRR